MRHQDVLATLGSEVLGQQRRNSRLAMTGRDGKEFSLPLGHSLTSVPVPDSWHGLSIDALPAGALEGIVVVLAIRDGSNGPERIAATQDLVLQAGWQIAVLGTKDAIDRLQRDSAPADE